MTKRSTGHVTGASLWEENDDWTMTATKTYMVIKAPKSMHLKVLKALRVIAALK